MQNEYSRDALLAFLKEAALAGRINPATARSRRNAAQQLFAHLTPAEVEDLRLVDVDTLAARCHKLQGSTVRPEVLSVYADRVREALSDYLRFVDAPNDFQSITSERRGPRQRTDEGARSGEEQALEAISLRTTNLKPDVIPVPIRPDKSVYLHGIPADLTADEARKIARVIAALVDEPTEGQA